MITRNNEGRILAGEYQKFLSQASINRDRVSVDIWQYLDVPDSVGTGRFDDNVHRYQVPTQDYFDTPQTNIATDDKLKSK
jgi:hypothetical protein